MKMKFELVTIVRIDEPEFGCEGRQDDELAMDIITLQDGSGDCFHIQMEEKRVLRLGLDEGMTINVLRGEDGSIMIQK